jgi:hypothetical protein
MHMRRRFGVVALGLAAMVLFLDGAGRVHADVIINYSSGTFQQTGIGAQFPTAFDTVTLSGQTGTATLTNGIPVVLPVNDLAFLVGFNSNGPFPYTVGPFSSARALTINGVAETIDQPFTDTIDLSQDTLALLGGAPTIFTLPGEGTVEVTLLGLPPITTIPGTATGTVSAQFLFTPAAPVPGPSSFALLSLGGLALAGWRRWRKRATA